MAGSSRFPTHLIPDDGTRYAPGEIVRVDQSSGRIQIVKDPAGPYEVVHCRQATEYAGDIPLLRVDLRKRKGTTNGPTATTITSEANRLGVTGRGDRTSPGPASSSVRRLGSCRAAPHGPG
jgi:hypothetical protein